MNQNDIIWKAIKNPAINNTLKQGVVKLGGIA